MRTTFIPLALAAGLAALAGPALAADTAATPRIVVSGEGEASVAPDMALLSLSVMREAKTAREALDANNDAMGAVISGMRAAGIEERDLQTAGVQVMPRYNFVNRQDGSQESVLIGYQVTNTLSVRVRDIDRSGEILDKAVTLGVNQGGGISFVNSDPSATVTEARKKAVADAIAKAGVLAQAAGVTLGRVLEITDVQGMAPPMPMLSKSFEMAADRVPVQAGENAYRVQVSVVFAIGK